MSTRCKKHFALNVRFVVAYAEKCFHLDIEPP